ncbi:DNA (cytosine-5-)-methyltransferase [Nonomuraea sp. NPDC026600]|uniref:DNA (cytosine-5-)-methyltransferase n=1 Tax=Nonomuraea sp. NPDC026600 TaxID=3155363 RepID=UPI0033E631FD
MTPAAPTSSAFASADPARPMTAVSLFAGIGGFELALQRASVKTVASVEIDAAARGVLAHHFPDSALFDDVRTVTGEQLLAAGFDPANGIITGGFPCQDLSVAGLRAGLDGGRSGLFFEIVRLARELRPRWLLLENVPGLLSSNRGRDMGIVVQELAELGYGVSWRVLDAQYFGVPQRRRRVFIVGCLGDIAGAEQVLFEPDSGARHPAPRRTPQQEAAARARRSAPAGSRAWGVAAGTPDIAGPLAANPGGHRTDLDGSGAYVTTNGTVTHTLRCGYLMSAEDGTGRGTPIVAYNPDGDPSRAAVRTEPSLLPADEPGRDGAPAAVTTLGAISHALTCEGHDAGEDGTGRGTPIVAYDLAQITSPANRSNPAPGDPCPPLCTTGRPAVTAIPVALRGRRGESMLEHGQLGDPAYALRTPGGGSSMPMVATTSRQAAQQVDAVAATVTAKWAKGTGGPAGDETQNLLPAYELNEYGQVGDLTTGGVRRLTPRECERLQGYPDDWTIRSGAKEQADSPRYRQLGNSLAVPVVRWAVGRLVVVDTQLRAVRADA